MAKKHFKYRCFEFSLKIIDLLEDLPKDYIYKILGSQLLRSATSIGANIIEAQAGRTKKEFVNYYHIALKSLNETKYWIAILQGKLKKEQLKKVLTQLQSEATEIGNIIGASLLTLKNKRSF